MSATSPTKLTPNTPAAGLIRTFTTAERARITVETDSIPKMIVKAKEHEAQAARNKHYFQAEAEAENRDLAAVYREVAAIFERGLAATAPASPVMVSRPVSVEVLPHVLQAPAPPPTEAQKFERLLAAQAAAKQQAAQSVPVRPTPPLSGV